MSAQRQTTPRSEPAVTKATANKTEKRTRPGKPKANEPTRREALVARTDRVRGLFQDTLSEVKKVNWPDQETTRNLTVVVIGISVAMGALLGTIDFVLLKLLGLF
jgi:preprotein translocase subunit SecE